MVLGGAAALGAECLGAKCQANKLCRQGEEKQAVLQCRHQTQSNFYHSGPSGFTPSPVKSCKLRHMHEKGKAALAR